jgi:Flp pilus assembly protein TadD
MTPDSFHTKIFFNMRNGFLIGLFLAMATLAVYWQVTGHAFLIYDDASYVTENRHIQDKFTLESVIWAFTTVRDSNWHPLTWLSHMLDIRLYGMNAGGHHLTSLFFHIANTLLLFIVFNKMTGDLWQSGFVAALFALHPLHVESVAWVAERKDVLSTFFWMLTMWSYTWYVDNQEVKRYFFVILFFTLGLMSKAMLVTLPFVLLLMDYWPLKRCQWRTERLREGEEENASLSGDILRLIWEKVPLLVLVVIASILTFNAQHSSGAVRSLEMYSLKVRVANAFVSYASYVVKAIWPVNLAAFYPHPGSGLPWWQSAGSALLVAAACFGALRTAKRYPYVLVGMFWYFGTLVPVIGLVQVGSQAMADRYTYIPLTGIFIIVAWGVPELLPKWRRRKIWLAITATVLLTILMVITWKQIRYWENNVVLFTHDVKVTQKNSLAHYVLGLSLEQEGKIDEAMFHYSRSLHIYPEYEVFFKMGYILYQQGKLDEAMVHFKESILRNPNSDEAHNNMGIIRALQGDVNGAIGHYHAAVKINPKHAGAYYNLGRIAANQGKTGEAINYYRKALRIEPDMTQALYHQAWIAATHEKKMFRDGNKAVEMAEKLCRLTEYKEALALDALAAAYAEVERFPDAVSTAQRGLHLAGLYGHQELSPGLKKRLQLYKDKRPYRQTR